MFGEWEMMQQKLESAKTWLVPSQPPYWEDWVAQTDQFLKRHQHLMGPVVVATTVLGLELPVPAVLVAQRVSEDLQGYQRLQEEIVTD
jgi:hypothetical protein